MVAISTLLQYLFEGDYLGFIQAVYVSAFQSADIFYALVIMLFTSPLYIRSKSLLFLSIIWILLGGLILVATPIIAGVAMLLMIFGLAGMLFKLFMYVRG